MLTLLVPLLVGADGEVEWSSTEDTPYVDVVALIDRYQRLLENKVTT